jgi:uncharacterized membrane protein YphA (DoxX/SURF4 family)
MNTLLSTVGDAAAVLARWLLGAIFIFMGMSKALHPVEFLKLIREYELTQSPWLLNSVAGMLPWFEVFCGILLLAGVAVRGSALVLILMLVPFTLVILRRGLAIQSGSTTPFCAVKFDCGCGGGEVFVCWKLVENVLLILLAGWLLASKCQKLCVRHHLTVGEAQL